MESRNIRRTRLVALAACAILVSAAAGHAYYKGYLSGPAEGDPLDISLAYAQGNLGELGLTAGDLLEFRVSDRYTSKHNGLTHIYFMQQHAGIDLYNGIMNFNVMPDGRILYMGNRWLGDLAGRAKSLRAEITAAEAVGFAAADIGTPLTQPLRQREYIGGDEQHVIFEPGVLSLRDIPVRLVYLRTDDGDLRLAWDMGIEPDDMHYWQMHVDAASGEILAKQNMVLTDSYNVFAWPAESPNHAGRTVVGSVFDPGNNPAADPTASTLGWHSDPSTKGNNVWAYTNVLGGPDYAATDLAYGAPAAGVDAQPPAVCPAVAIDPDFADCANPGTATFDYNFLLDLATEEPEHYRPAAVANLFYWNNVIHDILYLYGFDEAAGNMQEANNVGNTDGTAGDAVRAEGQDASFATTNPAYSQAGVVNARNNANMLTLPDGVPPRMQMYLWTTPLQLFVNSPYMDAYFAGSASFGPEVGNPGETGDLVLVDDGVGPDVNDACETPFVNAGAVAGNFCLLNRGTCEFGTKGLNCQNNGGLAFVLVNVQNDEAINMGPGVDGPSVTIPGVSIGNANGDAIKAAMPGVNVTMAGSGLLERDSDLDNGVIGHEYGHSVSIRATGGPSQTGCLSGAQQAGEGWSDLQALIETQDTPIAGPRGIGTYVTFQATTGGGIRPFPYSPDNTVNPQTYGDIDPALGLSAPHGVGTVWCAANWEMYWALVDGYAPLAIPGLGYKQDLYAKDLSFGNHLALQLIIDGMKMQPCGPSMLDSRDAQLAADLALNPTGGGAGTPPSDNYCAIWGAYAERGFGVFASSNGTSRDVIEDFELPGECVGGGTCLVPPRFDGVGSVVSDTSGTCRLIVSWDAANTTCDPSIVYDVYRDTTSGFVPSVGNRIATGFTGTVYNDDSVTSGQQYFYIVRARDGLGNEDPNSNEIGEVPIGTLTPGGTFLDDVDSTPQQFTTSEWAVRDDSGAGGTMAYATSATGPYPNSACLHLTSDTIYLGTGSTLSFDSRYDIEPAWDGGIVEIATAANSFQDWTKLDDPALYTSVRQGALGEVVCPNPGLRSGERIFGGFSGGAYLPFSADLSAYNNQAVKIRFVFGTDSGTNTGVLEGLWAVDNLVVTNTQTPGTCTGPTGPCVGLTPIFSDTFDTGVTEPAWTRVRNPLGNLDGGGSPLGGTAFGLEVSIDHNPPGTTDTEHYVLDKTPDEVGAYCAEFLFDPNSSTLGRRTKMYAARDTDNIRLLRAMVRETPVAARGGEPYQIRFSAQNDNYKWVNLPWVDLPDSETLVNLTWKQGTGAADGEFRLFLDASEVAQKVNFNNDDRPLGAQAIGNLGLFIPGTTALFTWDEFTSFGDPLVP